MVATCPLVRRRIQEMVLVVNHRQDMRFAMKRLIVEMRGVVRVVAVFATSTEKKSGQIAAQKKSH